MSSNNMSSKTATEYNQIDLGLLHEIQLELALTLKRICEAHDIPYFLVDGSALGAYYLNGFLPWDDDLDIGMYWKDYCRFLEICRSELPPQYKMKDHTTDKEFPCCFGQLIDTNYELKLASRARSKDTQAVFIDIHPFCDCSDNRMIRLAAYYRFKFYKLCLLQKRGGMVPGTKAERLFYFINKFTSEKWLLNRISSMMEYKSGGGVSML